MLKTDLKNVGHHILSVINYSCDECTNEICHMIQLMNHVVCIHEDKSYALAQLKNFKVEQKNQSKLV